MSQLSTETPVVAWQDRLSQVVDMMREMSLHTDPQAMVRAYAERAKKLIAMDGRLSLSRRGLSFPQYRITRSSSWKEEINPWREKDKLPLLSGGLIADLIYGEVPRVIDDLRISPDDPIAEYLEGYHSLLAIPMYEQGTSLNMVILMMHERNAISKDKIPELVWSANLFGRATSNLVLKDELERQYKAMDRELKVVGDIQRSLLPPTLPKIPTMDLGAYYQPAQRAGGDYYDFFPLPDDRWGIFIADVSGHGTPAAVLMAVTHCIAHTHPGPAVPPGKVLDYINSLIAQKYSSIDSAFVTAFYGVYNPKTRELVYASAGHNPPRLKRCQDGTLISLDQANGMPLGIWDEVHYDEAVQPLMIGDQIVFYTDGVTDATNPEGEFFGTHRLDRELENCALQAKGLLDSVLRSVENFTQGSPANDDRTMIVARIT